MTVLIIFIVILVSLLLLGFVLEAFFVLRDKQRFKPTGTLHDVGGYRLHIDVQGETQGNPTVICESGGGSFGIEWKLVQNELASRTRVVVYDRAGNGWSEHGAKPRTSQRIAEELHTLLAQANIEPPYIMVGQAFGGINIRKFAQLYPNEVVGMVFVDGSNPKQIAKPDFDTNKQLRQLLLPLLFRRIGLLRLISKRVFWQYRELPAEYQKAYVAMALWSSDTVRIELDAYFNTALDLPESVGEMPMVVLTRSFLDLGDGDLMDTDKKWLEYQQDLLTLSSNSTHHISEKGGRYLHVDDPELVVNAIKSVIGE